MGGAIAIKQMLKYREDITELDLSHNLLGASGARAIAENFITCGLCVLTLEGNCTTGRKLCWSCKHTLRSHLVLVILLSAWNISLRSIASLE